MGLLGDGGTVRCLRAARPPAAPPHSVVPPCLVSVGQGGTDIIIHLGCNRVPIGPNRGLIGDHTLGF